MVTPFLIEAFTGAMAYSPKQKQFSYRVMYLSNRIKSGPCAQRTFYLSTSYKCLVSPRHGGLLKLVSKVGDRRSRSQPKASVLSVPLVLVWNRAADDLHVGLSRRWKLRLTSGVIHCSGLAWRLCTAGAKGDLAKHWVLTGAMAYSLDLEESLLARVLEDSGSSSSKLQARFLSLRLRFVHLFPLQGSRHLNRWSRLATGRAAASLKLLSFLFP